MKKKDVNIKKIRLIDMQITLIAILCFGYWMYDVYANPIHKPSKPDDKIVYQSNTNDLKSIGPVKVYVEPQKNIEIKRNEPVSQPDEIELIIDDTKEIPEIKKETIENKKPEIATSFKDFDEKGTATENVVSRKKNNKYNAVTQGIDKPATKFAVDMFPMHPGCAKFSNNRDILACFKKKIQRLVLRKFNNSLGSELGINGKQHIDVYFEIDTEGNITNVKYRSYGKHKALEKEAKRVTYMLPNMKPAIRKVKKVRMSYNLPIILDIR